MTEAETGSPAPPPLEAVWHHALAGLPDGAVSPQHRAWLSLTRPLGLVEDTALLAAPNEFAKDVLDSRLRPVIAQALSTAYGREISVAVTVQPLPADADGGAPRDQPQGQDGEQAYGAFGASRDEPDAYPRSRYDGGGGYDGPAYDSPAYDGPGYERTRYDGGGFDRQGGPDAAPPGSSSWPSPAYAPPGSDGAGAGGGAPDNVRRLPGVPAGASRGPVEPARLNPKYAFETFVIGASNRFAHAAAVAVAEAPAKAYNPLFVYGESGLGKTHLLHAIGHYAQHLFVGARVRYVSSEEFTNDFINSIRDGKAETFRRRYRDVYILLFDDIQFLEHK